MFQMMVRGAGFLLALLMKVPTAGRSFQIDGMRFRDGNAQ